MARIHALAARRIWDSRGEPTIEVAITVEGGYRGIAAAPAAASHANTEAHEKRDGGAAFAGRDVLRTVQAANAEIARALRGLDASEQALIDRTLIALDATPSKSRLGANALIAASMAAAEAAAAARGIPLYRQLAGATPPGPLPLPVIQLYGGGTATQFRIDVSEIALVAVGADDYGTALEWSAEVTRAASSSLASIGRLQGVGPGGGLWPAFDLSEAAIEHAIRAIEWAGFTPGEDIALSLDLAASDLGRSGNYALVREGRRFSSDQWRAELLRWLRTYPIAAIEDPFAPDDLDAFAAFTEAAGQSIAVFANVAAATDARRIEALAAQSVCNGAVITPAQVGTLTEARAALDLARANGWSTMIATRCGETVSPFAMHLAVAWGADLLRAGGLMRGERTAVWNEGIRLAETLPTRGQFPPRS